MAPTTPSPLHLWRDETRERPACLLGGVALLSSDLIPIDRLIISDRSPLLQEGHDGTVVFMSVNTPATARS
jgi:hypothetical protein